MPDEYSKSYELTLILSPELEERGLNSIEQEIEKEIKNLGGDLKKKGKPEKRSLAYPIKKFQSAYYLIVNFFLNPNKLKELAKTLKHKREILRYLITTAVLEKKPSPLKPSVKTAVQKIKPSKKKIKQKIKEIAEEVSEEKIKKIKKESKERKKPKLEEIDKKLDEILGL